MKSRVLQIGEQCTSCASERRVNSWRLPLQVKLIGRLKNLELKEMIMIITRDFEMVKKKQIYTSEAERKLGDEGSGDAKADQERPVAIPLALEENRPWIEFRHFSLLFRFLFSLSHSLSLSRVGGYYLFVVLDRTLKKKIKKKTHSFYVMTIRALVFYFVILDHRFL